MDSIELVGIILESHYSTWDSVAGSSDSRPSFEGRPAPVSCLHQYASTHDETWVEDHDPEDLVEWLNAIPIGSFIVAEGDSVDSCQGDHEGTRYITRGWVKRERDSFVPHGTDEFVGYQDE